MVDLYPQDADDRRFLDAVARIVDVVPRDLRDLWVIRVDNWFDHKWLRFSGMGRVPFEDPRPSHPGVSLDEFSQDKLTFPPFSPRRILRQDIWTYGESAGATAPVHRRVLQHSATNLHRRVESFSDSMAAIWFSSRSEDNRHGSVMQYISQGANVEAWYASLRLQGPSWRIHLTKGIDRQRIADLVHDDGAPTSAIAERKP